MPCTAPAVSTKHQSRPSTSAAVTSASVAALRSRPFDFTDLSTSVSGVRSARGPHSWLRHSRAAKSNQRTDSTSADIVPLPRHGPALGRKSWSSNRRRPPARLGPSLPTTQSDQITFRSRTLFHQTVGYRPRPPRLEPHLVIAHALRHSCGINSPRH